MLLLVFLWPVVWTVRKCVFWCCLFVMLWCLIGARLAGRARFRCCSGWLMMPWCFVVYLFVVFVLFFICWCGVILRGGSFVCGLVVLLCMVM
jgi:hypothetical protein